MEYQREYKGQRNQRLMESILIVDDNPTYVEGLHAILQDQGYFVDYALSVLDALEKIKNKEYALIFVDMKMHDFSGVFSDRAGLNLVPLIKSKSPKSKIIILTAGSKDTDAVETIEQGAVKYLRKGNFSVDYLLKLIHQLLENPEKPQKERKTKKLFVKGNFISWIIERSYGILDEVLAGLLLTILIYMIGRVSGLLSASPIRWSSSRNSLIYVIAIALVVLVILSTYFWARKRMRKNRK
jgi:CheY-like chemotaxis protein